MNITYRQAVEADNDVIRSMLASHKLPTESIGTGTTDFYFAVDNGTVVGVAGFEYYGKEALLRSVAVLSHFQKKGAGSQIVDWMIELARKKRLTSIFLLTESASDFFAKKGFMVIDRSSIKNEAMNKSSQFCGGCCSSATCMMLTLD